MTREKFSPSIDQLQLRLYFLKEWLTYVSPGFNGKEFYVPPTECIHLCCTFIRLKRYYLSAQINSLVFITAKESVHCAVGTLSSDITEFNCSL